MTALTAAVGMASPAMLSGVFCGRLPESVCETLFQLGFHLWLARPYDMIINEVQLGDALITVRTTVACVQGLQLTADARRIADWFGYTLSFDLNGWPRTLARPVVFSDVGAAGGDITYVESNRRQLGWVLFIRVPIRA